MGNNQCDTKSSTNNPMDRLSLQCELIAEDTTTIRSLDWDRSRFDIEFGLRNGTTYNSFIIQGAQTAIIDTSHAKFQKSWLGLLKQKINPNEIDFLISLGFIFCFKSPNQLF